MSIRKFKPWPVLIDVIEELFVTDSSATESSYSIAPSPQFVMGFQLEGRLKTIRSGADHSLDPSGVTGIQTQSRLYQGLGKTRSILVRFKPWGPSCFFSDPWAS